MTHDNLPVCRCGVRSYRPGGGQMGPNGSSQWHTCEACGRPSVKISHYMTVLACPTDPVTEFPKEGLDYLNGPLDVTMRAYGKAVEEVRQAIDKAGWNLFCDMNGLPLGTKVDHNAEHQRCLRRPDGSEVMEDGALRRADAYFDSERVRVRNNAELLEAPLPPKIPGRYTSLRAPATCGSVPSCTARSRIASAGCSGGAVACVAARGEALEWVTAANYQPTLPQLRRGHWPRGVSPRCWQSVQDAPCLCGSVVVVLRSSIVS